MNAAIEGANVDPMIDLVDSLDDGEEKTNKQTTKKKTKKKEESRQYSNVALMWEKALAWGKLISANVSNETVNDGVRMQSAKFCESACLLLAGVGWGASVVKPTHKLLKLDELGKLSDEKRGCFTGRAEINHRERRETVRTVHVDVNWRVGDGVREIGETRGRIVTGAGERVFDLE